MRPTFKVGSKYFNNSCDIPVHVTSMVLKLDQDMSYPIICKYTSLVIPWHFSDILS